MSIDVKTYQVMDKAAFQESLDMWALSVKKVWDNASALALDAICQYYQHSWDSSRLFMLLNKAEAAGAGSVVTCLKYVINNATGVNLKSGKHNPKKLERNADAQSIIATLESQGLNAFRNVGKDSSGSKDETEKPPQTKRFKAGVDSELTELVNDIIETANGAKDDERATESLISMLKGDGKVRADTTFEGISKDVTNRLRMAIENIRILESHEESVETVKGKAVYTETGHDKAVRAAEGFFERTDLFLKDFSDSVKDLAKAAQDEADAEVNTEAANDAEAA